MTWRHLHDLLTTQTNRDFPHADARPFAKEIRAAKKWEKIEQLLTRAERRSRPRVEGAIAQFITQGTWPPKLSAKDRMWISARLHRATNLTMQLTVQLSLSGATLPLPPNQTEVLFWLLVIQWDCFGRTFFLADLKFAFQKPPRSPRASFPDPPGLWPPDGAAQN